MTRHKPIIAKNWHCWTFSMNCGTNKVNKPPPTISAAMKEPQKLISRISAKKRKYSFPTYKIKRNKLLYPSWKHRKSKFPLARHWWTASSQTVICRRLFTNGFWVITKKRPDAWLACMINTGTGLTAILIMNMTIRGNGSPGPAGITQKKWNVYSTFTNKVRYCEHFAENFCYY